jgi:TonB family protein
MLSLIWPASVAVALTLQGAPQSPALPEGLLTRPVTPGSVALLVLDARSAEVQQRLTEALRDARPAVRAIAARVAAVTTSAGHAATLIEVLARESDQAAAREEVRALLALDPGAHAAVSEAVARLGGEPALVLAESIARSRGAEILAALPMLFERSGDPAGLANVLSIVVRERPDDRKRLAEGVILIGDAVLWRAYCAMLDHHRIAVDTSTWLAAINAPAPAVRTATLFAVASALENRESLAAPVVDAALPVDPWPPASPGDTDYARELVARIRGRRPSPADWAAVVTGLGGRLPLGLWSRMTDAERNAARAAGFGRGGKGTGAGYEEPLTQTTNAAGRPARIAAPIVPGLFTEMATLTGCRFGSDPDYAAARLTYRPDGRARQVSLMKGSIPRRCGPFVSAAMSLLVARADHALADQPTDVVFLPLQSTMLACVDRPMASRAFEVGESGVTMPELEREQKPRYTPEAMSDKVEGKVLLRVIVADSGCVTQADVLRPLHPGLDLEALNAILQWRFKPALRDGQPVALLVTVEVGFALRR